MKTPTQIKKLYALRLRIFKLQEEERAMASYLMTEINENKTHIINEGAWSAAIEVTMVRHPSWKDELTKRIGVKKVNAILESTIAIPTKKVILMHKGEIKNGFHRDVIKNQEQL